MNKLHTSLAAVRVIGPSSLEVGDVYPLSGAISPLLKGKYKNGNLEEKEGNGEENN